MEIKDVKVGDKVQLRKDIPEEELAKILGSHGLIRNNVLELQRRGKVTVLDIQEAGPGEGNGWDSITLKESGFYWPIELFEPVKKSKEEQVQEDIQNVKDIIKRYGLSEQEGYAAGLVRLLTRYGEEFLSRTGVKAPWLYAIGECVKFK